jgi:hypothetical protein
MVVPVLAVLLVLSTMPAVSRVTATPSPRAVRACVVTCNVNFDPPLRQLLEIAGVRVLPGPPVQQRTLAEPTPHVWLTVIRAVGKAALKGVADLVRMVL